MGQAIGVRGDFKAGEVRRLAKRARNVGQARRLLAIAAVLDGASRAEAAKVGGMDRQTLRDWVIRFNEHGPDGLINLPSPGAPSKLDGEHRAFLARIVDEGPIPVPLRRVQSVLGHSQHPPLRQSKRVQGLLRELAGCLKVALPCTPHRIRAHADPI